MGEPISRRSFLKLGGTVAATTATGTLAGVADANAASVVNVGRSTLPYPAKIIAQASSLKPNVPQMFSFPDAASPCAVVKLGRAVPGGVGPQNDIVAYSTLCTHQGCPVAFDPKQATFKCPCHFSIFDPAHQGQMVCGQATQNLPQVTLEYGVKDGSVRAVAVDGLIYGRQSNIL